MGYKKNKIKSYKNFILTSLRDKKAYVPKSGHRCLEGIFPGVVRWSPAGRRRRSVCVQNALTAVYLGNIASLFIRGATFLKVIESISSGWPGCVDILQYLPVTFAHFDARPSFTHEKTTSRSWAQILISKMKRSVAGRATVQHLQGSGNT